MTRAVTQFVARFSTWAPVAEQEDGKAERHLVGWPGRRELVERLVRRTLGQDGMGAPPGDGEWADELLAEPQSLYREMRMPKLLAMALRRRNPAAP